MGREYFKGYHSYLESIEYLTDAERGRLFTAMLIYSSTGEAPELSGNERYVFSSIRGNIAREIKEYEKGAETNSVNGKKGGRPKKATESEKNPSVFERVEKNPPVFSKTEKSQDKDKEEDKDKDKDKELYDVTSSHTRTRAKAAPPTVEEVAEYCQERQNGIVAQRFVDYYSAQGWKLSNGNTMKDWRAAVRNWESRDRQQQAANNDGFICADTDYSAIGAMMDEDW